jgi:hypothetical protein
MGQPSRGFEIPLVDDTCGCVSLALRIDRYRSAFGEVFGELFGE